MHIHARHAKSDHTSAPSCDVDISRSKTYGRTTDGKSLTGDALPVGLDELARRTGTPTGGVLWRTYANLPAAIPDARNPDVLIRGGWLERGGVSFFVSTAGTGKSIHDMQLCLCAFNGINFSGLTFARPLKAWDIRDEDSDRRLSIDRDDIIRHLNERYPGHDWDAAAKAVRFSNFNHTKGAEFIDILNDELLKARTENRLPDLIVINPLFAFFGGKITEAEDCGGFFRGGIVRGKSSIGLSILAEQFGVGIIIYHHTPKPPKDEREYRSWLQSAVPEYCAAGSGDIINAGRSFITMLKVPRHAGRVVLIAGKNGAGLGWKDADGKNTTRLFLRHGTGTSSSGEGPAHYWDDVDSAEIQELSAALDGKNATGSKDKPVEPLPKDERPTAMAVFKKYAEPITMTVARAKVRCAINLERRKADSRARLISIGETKTMIECLVTDGELISRPLGKNNATLIGLHEAFERIEQPALDGFDMTAGKTAARPDTADAETVFHKSSKPRKFRIGI